MSGAGVSLSPWSSCRGMKLKLAVVTFRVGTGLRIPVTINQLTEYLLRSLKRTLYTEYPHILLPGTWSIRIYSSDMCWRWVTVHMLTTWPKCYSSSSLWSYESHLSCALLAGSLGDHICKTTGYVTQNSWFTTNPPKPEQNTWSWKQTTPSYLVLSFV